MKLYTSLIFLAALWGASFLFLRIASPEFGPVALIFVRTGVAALVLVPFVFFAGKHRDLLTRWRQFLFTGAMSTALPFTLFAYATLYIPAGHASILNATTPFFSAIVAFYWLKERLTVVGSIGLVLGFLGVYVIARQNGSGASEIGAVPISIAPIAATLVATSLYAISSSYAKLKMSDLKPVVVAAGSQLYAAMVLLPLTLISIPDAMPSAKAWIGALCMAIFSTALALIIFFRLLQSEGVTRTVSVTYLIPAFGVLWGYLFLDEKVSLPMLVGGGMVLLGVSFTTGMYDRWFVKRPRPL